GAAVGHHLFGRVLKAVVALELGGDRLAQRRQTGGRGVAVNGALGVKRFHRGCADGGRGFEVGLAGRQRDHVFALGREGLGPRRKRQCGGGLDAPHAGCEFQQSHVSSQVVWILGSTLSWLPINCRYVVCWRSSASAVRMLSWSKRRGTCTNTV